MTGSGSASSKCSVEKNSKNPCTLAYIENDGTLRWEQIRTARTEIRAGSGKPHTIAEELVLPAVREVFHTVVHTSPDQIIKAVPLTDNSVQRGADEMNENNEETLCNTLTNSKVSLVIRWVHFTRRSIGWILCFLIHFVKVENLFQELLLQDRLKKTQKGQCSTSLKIF